MCSGMRVVWCDHVACDLMLLCAGVVCAANWGRTHGWLCSVQPCPPLMAPLASGCRARRSAHGVVLQRRLPTGSVHGTHRARLRTGTHKSMAPLMRVPCNAPINGRRATARSAIGVIAHRTPLVASGVPALRGVQRCGDSALRRFGDAALRRCGASSCAVMW